MRAHSSCSLPLRFAPLLHSLDLRHRPQLSALLSRGAIIKAAKSASINVTDIRPLPKYKGNEITNDTAIIAREAASCN